MTRRPDAVAAATMRATDGVEVVRGDADDPDGLAMVFRGVDRAFLMSAEPIGHAAAIDPADVAAVAAEVLTAPAGHLGAAYQLSAPELLTPAEELAHARRAQRGGHRAATHSGPAARPPARHVRPVGHAPPGELPIRSEPMRRSTAMSDAEQQVRALGQRWAAAGCSPPFT